jgi:hypothetical protein
MRGNADNETSGTQALGCIWLSDHAHETKSRRHETRRPRTPELGSRMTYINIMLEPLQPETSNFLCDSVMTFRDPSTLAVLSARNITKGVAA